MTDELTDEDLVAIIRRSVRSYYPMLAADRLEELAAENVSHLATINELGEKYAAEMRKAAALTAERDRLREALGGLSESDIELARTALGKKEPTT